MRELKFRAWDERNKNMVYDLTLKTNNGEEIKIHAFPNHTFMQLTGLHDKNGTPIYEGDIIKDARGSLFLVYWDESEYAFKLDYKYYHDKDKGECHTYLPVYSRKGEVIGNIYKNPELLRS